MKRYRYIEAKPDSVLVKYGKDEGGDVDLVYAWRDSSGDGARVVVNALMTLLEGTKLRNFDNGELNFRKLIDKLGFDVTTLKIEVKRKQVV